MANNITLPGEWNQATYHGGGIPGNEQFPATSVSWFEADAYCRWAGGRLPTEAYGLYDVAGNVWEWCSTKYADYPYNPNDGRENPPVSHSECCRVLRGGSRDGGQDLLPCAYRATCPPDWRNLDIGVGFRCARTPSRDRDPFAPSTQAAHGEEIPGWPK